MDLLISKATAPAEQQDESKASTRTQPQEATGLNPSELLAQAGEWLDQGGQMSFRRLNQLADEVAGRLFDADDIAETATIKTAALVSKPPRAVLDDSDLNRLHRLKSYVSDQSQYDQIPRSRKLRKISPTVEFNSSDRRWLQPFHMTSWEDDVIWDDSSDSQSSSAEPKEDSDEPYRAASNPLINRGLWIRGIVWDDEEVFDDSEDEHTEWESYTATGSARSGDILPPTSVIYGYHGPVPLWIDVNDPSVHVMEDRGGSMRYMGDEDEEDEEDEHPQEASASTDRAAFNSQTSFSKREKERMLQAQKIQRIREISGRVGFDATASIVNTRRGEEDNQIRRRVIATPAVDHASYATRHPQPADLSYAELKLFHRPRIDRPSKKPWMIERRTNRGPAFAGRSRNYRGGELLPQMTNAKELVPLEGDFIVIEYAEEFPPILTNMGMGSRIINYYRATDEDEGKDGLEHASTRTARQSRLPRHLQRLQRHETTQSDRTIPKFPEGQTVVLTPTDESPFLGDILPGNTQACLSNNLYRAPLFEQQSLGNDFLLIRGPSKKEEPYWRCYVRELPRMYICGQQEPQKMVPLPSKKTTAFQNDWIKLHVARLLISTESATDVAEVKSLFRSSYYPETTIKKILKELADMDTNGIRYTKKPDSLFPNIEELEKQISVEEVCLNECSAAGDKRLELYGIEEMRTPTVVANALDRLVLLHRYRKQQAEAARSKANELVHTPKGPLAARFAAVLERAAARVDKLIRIARFLHEKLQVTPWNLTSEFVQGHLQAQGTGMLQLTGVGDPSGRGEGFSYLRVTRQKARRKSMDLKAELAVSQITGTNQDLRKLSVQEATRVLVGMGINPSDIKKLKRWDLIHMIREVANKAAHAGQENALVRYARGQKLNHATQLAEYKVICNRLWGYQEAALSATERPADADDNDDYNDDGDDADELDFEESLQDMLERNRAGGRMGLSRSDGEDARDLQSWREELQKHDAAKLQAQIVISNEEMKSADGMQQPRAQPRARPKKVVKRIERIIDREGKERVTISFIVDEEEVARVEKNKKELRKRIAHDAVQQRRRLEGTGAIKNHKYALSISSIQLKIANQDRDEEELAYEQVRRGTTRRRSNASAAPARLPQAALAAQLEDIWVNLWGSNASLYFRDPVDTHKYPDYLKKVATPIDLRTIRAKIAAFKYSSFNEFLADLNLIVSNSVAYNGDHHPVTKDARSLVRAAQNFAGTEVVQEELQRLSRELQKKNASLNRTSGSIVMPTVTRPAPSTSTAAVAPARPPQPVVMPEVKPVLNESPMPIALSQSATPMSTATPGSIGTASMSQFTAAMEVASDAKSFTPPPTALTHTLHTLDSSSEGEEDDEGEEGEEEEGVDESEVASSIAPSTSHQYMDVVASELPQDYVSSSDAESQQPPMDVEQSEVSASQSSNQAPMVLAKPQPADADESSGDEEVLAEG